MKAPDKIYIQPNAHDGWFEGNKPNDNFVEYVRKDTLLEWAKEKAEDYKGTANIRRSFEMMIKKIESL